MPQKLKYDGLPQLLGAMRAVVAESAGNAGVTVGKEDFKSAFKTLPPKASHNWLCWALVFNPEEYDWVAVPLWSHVFGNLGGVTGWYRTARAIQHVMLTVFCTTIFFYVDDVFWAGSDVRLPKGMTVTGWISELFKRVVTDLLGWSLDPEKRSVGLSVVVLGLQISVQGSISWWSLAST